MTGQINTLAAQTAIDERHRAAARARTASPALTRTRRRIGRPAIRLVRPHLASPSAR